jgi:hypothetical protein
MTAARLGEVPVLRRFLVEKHRLRRAAVTPAIAEQRLMRQKFPCTRECFARMRVCVHRLSAQNGTTRAAQDWGAGRLPRSPQVVRDGRLGNSDHGKDPFQRQLTKVDQKSQVLVDPALRWRGVVVGMILQ